jgi:PAS domain S-box-containing protein
MAWQYTPYTAPVFLSAVVGLGVAAFAWQHRDRPGATPLAVFMIAAGFWSFAEGMNLAHADLVGKIFWTRVEIAISGVVGIAWLALVLEYTGNDEWVTRRVFGALALEPLLVAGVLVWQPSLIRANLGMTTVDSMALITEDLAMGFYLHVVFVYLLILVGAGLLVKVVLFAEGLYRTQSTALLLAMFLPLVGNVMYLFDYLPAGLDPTNIGFLFTGFIITGTILRRQLLEIVPVAREVARDEILQNMDDRVFVLDDRDRVADLNPAAVELVDATKTEAIGSPISEVFPEIADILLDDDQERMQVELPIETDSGRRYFDVRVSPMYRARGMVAGRLVSLRDVTQQRQQRQRLDVLNRLLRHNLRNEMNVIAGNAELVERELSDPDLVDRVEQIEDTADEITTRSDKVGRVARLLEEEHRDAVDLSTMVREEVQNVRNRYPNASITVDVPDTLPVAAGASLAIAVNELVTNAVEHDPGEPSVRVSAHRVESGVEVSIADSGPGIHEQELTVLDEGKETALQHGSGVGLWVVNWIVQQFGGQLHFESGDTGSTVTIHLPPSDEELVTTDPVPADD